MAKRKREQETPAHDHHAGEQPLNKKFLVSNGNGTERHEASTKKHVSTLDGVSNESLQDPISIQIITGSYDRVLHGIIATIPTSNPAKVHFQDNFLFTAHSSAIRCLALSPATLEDNAEASKVMLVSGGTDEKINLYSISTSLPKSPSLPTLSSMPSLENPKNKELGTLLHHTSSVNVLHFPSRSKLISGSDDNTIAISRTRDWTVLTKVKAPMPKVQGRPSGDTAPFGGTPAGINDFAIHPSSKLMISVGKGEKCMRLWNLVTGKKANVLSFERDMLQSVGEGKWSRGEGQKVVWNSVGNQFAIAFEKGVAIFGMDSEIACIAVPNPATKIHQVGYVTFSTNTNTQELLAVSTENGQILFYSTDDSESSTIENSSEAPAAAKLQAMVGGREHGITGRIKDFQIISLPRATKGVKIIVAACSDGAVTIWQIRDSDLVDTKNNTSLNDASIPNGQVKTSEMSTSKEDESVPRIGVLLGKYATGNRITCMQALQLHHLLSEDEEDDNIDGNDGKEVEVEELQGFDNRSEVDVEDEFEGFD